MPGRLLDEHQKLVVKPGTMDEAKQWDQAHSEHMANGVLEAPSTVQHHMNKINTDVKPLVQGLPASSQPLMLPSELQESLKHLPPEIQQITEGYHPLSKLLDRAAQETFSQLVDLVSRLDTPIGQRQVNGSGHSNQQSSEGIDKRRQWLEFAQTNRERFLKLFVLLQWGETTREPIGRLVNVMDWMRQRQAADELAHERLGWLKKEMFDIQTPNPDIERALDILTTNQSARIPDLGYLPQPTLSPQTLLDNFNNINTLLHVRLNVHEELPKALQKYSIHSGRVTFTSPDEFEMDLSILDEDPTSRFYLIDLRFLFTPCSEMPPGQLRVELEMRSDSILASEGLVGCYDFLHDFILTYKLSILWRHALELARGSWSGNLRVERVHRSLVLQYWTGRPGKKSWIEIGISSGETLNQGPFQVQKMSKLVVKWTRHGRQVPSEETITFDQATLDVESLLQQVVGKHVRNIFETAQSSLKKTLAGQAHSGIYVTVMSNESSDCSLTVPLLSPEAATLRIEATTGLFAVSPASAASRRAEDVFNKARDPIEELSQQVESWRIEHAISAFKAAAFRFGWDLDLTRLTLDSQIRKQFFTDPNASPILIRRWQPSNWVVAACYDGCSSFQAWLLDIRAPQQKMYAGEGLQIVSARRLYVDTRLVLAAFFKPLWGLAFEAIQSLTLYNRLREVKLPFSLQLRTESNVDRPRIIAVDVSKLRLHKSISTTVALSFRVNSATSAKTGQPWSTVLHTARAAIAPGPCISALISSVKSDEISVTPGGALAVLNQSPLGSSNVVDKLIEKICRMSEILIYLEALHNLQLKIRLMSFDSISFCYAAVPHELFAGISWKTAAGKATLTFAPGSNPHNRLLPLFRAALNDERLKSGTSLSILPTTLLITLPLLQAFDDIEATTQGRPQIHVIDTESYSIVYSRPRCTLLIKYRIRMHEGYWYAAPDKQSLQHASQVPGQNLVNEKLQQSLSDFFKQSGQGNAKSLKIGIAAKPDTIHNVICRLDKVIRTCADSDPVAPTPQPGQQPDSQDGPGLQPGSQQQPQADGQPTEAPPTSQSQPSQSQLAAAQPMSRKPSSQLSQNANQQHPTNKLNAPSAAQSASRQSQTAEQARQMGNRQPPQPAQGGRVQADDKRRTSVQGGSAVQPGQMQARGVAPNQSQRGQPAPGQVGHRQQGNGQGQRQQGQNGGHGGNGIRGNGPGNGRGGQGKEQGQGQGQGQGRPEVIQLD